MPLVIAGGLLSTLHQSSLGSLYLIVPGKLHALWYTPLLPILFFMSAIAVGLAPDQYAQTDAARRGLAGLKTYFKKNPPAMAHHRAMLLWAGSYLGELQTDDERKATIKELFKLQKADGGWNVATLGDWKRADKKEQDTESSDGYATGFCVYVLRRVLTPLSPVEAMELLLSKMSKTKTNGEFMAAMQK